MTLTKADIIEKLYRAEKFKRTEVANYVETLLEIIKEKLEAGEDILISGFGKFCIKDKGSRRGRNPHTGEPIILEPRRIVTFRPSGKLRDKINGR